MVKTRGMFAKFNFAGSTPAIGTRREIDMGHHVLSSITITGLRRLADKGLVEISKDGASLEGAEKAFVSEKAPIVEMSSGYVSSKMVVRIIIRPAKRGIMSAKITKHQKYGHQVWRFEQYGVVHFCHETKLLRWRLYA